MKTATSATSKTDPKPNSHRARDVALGGGVAALLAWLLFGNRRGGGGVADGRSLSGLQTVARVSRPPCKVRLDSRGWQVNGEHVSGIADVLAACRKHGEVRMFVTGGANYSQLARARKAFAAAGLVVYESRKQPRRKQP